MFEWPIFDHLKRVSTNLQAFAVASLTFWVYLLETLIFDGSEYDLMKSTNLWWYNFPLFHFLQAISSDCRILCLDTLCKVCSCCTPLPTDTRYPSQGRAGGTPQPLLLLYLLRVFLLQSWWGRWHFPAIAGDVHVAALLTKKPPKNYESIPP